VSTDLLGRRQQALGRDSDLLSPRTLLTQLGKIPGEPLLSFIRELLLFSGKHEGPSAGAALAPNAFVFSRATIIVARSALATRGPLSSVYRRRHEMGVTCGLTNSVYLPRGGAST